MFTWRNSRAIIGFLTVHESFNALLEGRHTLDQHTHNEQDQQRSEHPLSSDPPSISDSFSDWIGRCRWFEGRSNAHIPILMDEQDMHIDSGSVRPCHLIGGTTDIIR